MLTCNVLASIKSVFVLEPTAYVLYSSFTARHTLSAVCGSFLDIICLNLLASQQWMKPFLDMTAISVLLRLKHVDLKRKDYYKSWFHGIFAKLDNPQSWKFQPFSVIQILREINFWNFRSSKSAISSILEALYCVTLVNCSFQKVQTFIKIKIESP